jgi:hypothetical protein
MKIFVDDFKEANDMDSQSSTKVETMFSRMQKI